MKRSSQFLVTSVLGALITASTGCLAELPATSAPTPTGLSHMTATQTIVPLPRLHLH
jgi:hypothetical protein